MMNFQDKRNADIIIGLLRAKVKESKDAHIKAVVDEAGAIAQENRWDELNPGDGVGSFSTNPYSSSGAMLRTVDARHYAERISDAYDWFIDRFTDEATK